MGWVERSECPTCGGAEAHTLYERPLADPTLAPFLSAYYQRDLSALDGAYRLDECGCGLIWQRYVGDDAFLSELYGEWIDRAKDPEAHPHYGPEIADPRASRDGQELMMLAACLGKPLEGLRVLDFGMGWALWLRVARALGADAYGYDLSAECRAYAAARGVKVVDDLTAAGPFDIINTDQVMEHVVNPLEIVTALAAVLAPGGILKIAVPRGDRVRGLLADRPDFSARALNPVHPLEHVNAFTGPALDALGRKVGLEPFTPGLGARLAFMGQGGLRASPKSLAKSFGRVWRRFHNPHTLYRVFR